MNVDSFILFVGICCVKQYVDKNWMHMLSFWPLINDANVMKTNKMIYFWMRGTDGNFLVVHLKRQM